MGNEFPILLYLLKRIIIFYESSIDITIFHKFFKKLDIDFILCILVVVLVFKSNLLN